MAYEEKKSQAVDVIKGDLAYPGLKPYCHGEPTLQCAQEAVAHCEERAAFRKAHPDAPYMIDEDFRARMREHEYMERAEDLLFGRCNPRTFEPGDAFTTDNYKKED